MFRFACGSERAYKTYRAFPFGHIDLVVGKEATRTVWPLVRNWLARR